MFSWFLGRQQIDEVDPDPKTIKNFWDHVEILYKNGATTCVCLTAAQLQNIQLWTFNRELNHARIEELYQAMVKNEYLSTPLTLAECNDSDRVYLVDGQHRYHAMLKYYGPDEKILALVHTVPDEKAVVKLFKCVNNTYPLSPAELPKDQLVELVEAITHLWPMCIVNKETTKRPYITQRHLKLELERLVPFESIDIPRFCECVQKVNEKYRTKADTCVIASKTREKMDIYNYYLAVPGKPETWIKKAINLYK